MQIMLHAFLRQTCQVQARAHTAVTHNRLRGSARSRSFAMWGRSCGVRAFRVAVPVSLHSNHRIRIAKKMERLGQTRVACEGAEGQRRGQLQPLRAELGNRESGPFCDMRFSLPFRRPAWLGCCRGAATSVGRRLLGFPAHTPPPPVKAAPSRIRVPARRGAASHELCVRVCVCVRSLRFGCRCVQVRSVRSEQALALQSGQS